MSLCNLQLSPLVEMTDEGLLALARANEAWRLEVNSQGELLVMAPTGGESGIYNAGLTADLLYWNRKAKLGKVFDSSTLFRLPNGARRGPDLAWVRSERWAQLSPEDRKRFPPLCPDFVIELRSATDRLSDLQEKMAEYVTCGLHLGWLLDFQTDWVEIYRSACPVERLKINRQTPPYLVGDPVLPGFVLNLGDILALNDAS